MFYLYLDLYTHLYSGLPIRELSILWCLYTVYRSQMQHARSRSDTRRVEENKAYYDLQEY